ncbi:POTRA domain, ShlB-type [Mariprofundus micogutta]|uniref:POTRA domain, ShlB-type n=1 Tax=Mariprofundus micogutta TaxID=1921010 RepID=A0A1L8CQ96_9PROT|nr:POTRA domain-containing protein [Mariprofundus micogutta]GAV21091.1 POTRA domain, ShlB-type [Mariprofundus micogutta]
MIMLNLTRPIQCIATATIACLMLAQPAFAADQDIIPPTDSTPSSEQGDINTNPTSAEVPAGKIIVPSAQKDTGTSTGQEIAPADATVDSVETVAPIISNEINAFETEGNTLIDTGRIQQHLSGFLGLKKNSTNLFKVKVSVLKLYQSSGLKGVRISYPQAASDGTVHITIAEGGLKAETTNSDMGEGLDQSSETTTASQDDDGAIITPDSGNEPTQDVSTAPNRESEQPAIAETVSAEQTTVKDEEVSVDKPETQAQADAAMNTAENRQEPAPLQPETKSEQAENTMTATIEKTDSPSTMPLPEAPAWLADGWQQLEAGNTDAAMAIWQREVNKMHAYRYLSFIGVYMSQDTAINILKRAGLEYHALMLVAEREGKQAYYVLSALKTSYDKAQRQLELAGLRKRMGIEYMYASAARRFHGTAVAAEVKTKSEAVEALTDKAKPDVQKAPVRKKVVKKAPRKALAKAPAKAAVEKKPEPPVVAEVEKLDGKISGFEIYGNSLISDKIIQQKLRPYLGDNKSSSDLMQARDKITQLYQGRGYPVVAVSMPEDVKGEIIPVRIYEVSGTKRALAR